MGDEWLNKGKQVAKYKEVCGVVRRLIAKEGGGRLVWSWVPKRRSVRREVRRLGG